MMLETALSIVVGALLLIAVLALVVFCTPVSLSTEFDTNGAPGVIFNAAILGGICPLPSIHGGRANANRKPKPHRPKKTKKRAGQSFRALAPQFLQAVPKFLSEIFSRIKIEAINAKVSFGFADPSDTGVAYGVLLPFALLAERAKSSSVKLQPNFDKATLSSKGNIAARFTPISLLAPALAFGWSAFVAPRLSDVFR